jgi:hypothetical protein
MTWQKEDDMSKPYNPLYGRSPTQAERNLGVRTLIWCKPDGFPNWIAECSPAAVGVGFTRAEAVKAAVAKYRSIVAAEAIDEPEPDYGGAMDSTGHIHSDAEGGL